VRGFVLALAALLLLVAAPGRGQGRGQAQEGAALQPPASATATAIAGVVAAGTRIELVKFPVQGTEGPVGLPDGSGIIFTETRADHITKVDAGGNTSTFVEKSNGSNGLAWDPKGRLISVQRAPGNEKVGVLYPAGSEATLVDNFEGKPFNRLNDLVVSTKGGVYFTDTQGVYYLAPGAPGRSVKKVIPDIKNPNGVMLSPDEKTAYANDKDGLYLLAFDVQPDGTLANRRNFGKYNSLTVPGHKDPLLAEDNGADGLAVDTDGRVYVATNLGVEVFSPRGDHLGVIPIGIWGGEQNMLRKPQNLTFAGADRKTLYTVGANAVYRVQLLAQGLKTRGK
jgi:gluconolactonase